MTSGAEAIDLSLNVIEILCMGMNRAPQCFFKFFLAVMLLEIIVLVFLKLFSQNLNLLTSGGLIIGMI